MKTTTRKTKTIIPNSENLPITEYWNRLPKRTNAREFLLDKIFRKTGREANSVRRWFLGISEPTPRIKQQVADILGSTVEVLFPNTNHAENID